MKLKVGSKQIVLPVDAKISIEKSSPLLNDDTGSFSYPFSVPTGPNQQALGWPGRLQRVGDIADQSFILEDSGIQVMRGEVDFDDITAKEIGVILKSGYTEFYKKMEGKRLADINFGSESWPITTGAVTNKDSLDAAIDAKMAVWSAANTTDNGMYVLSTFVIGMDYATGDLYVNKYIHSDGSYGIKYFHAGTQHAEGSYCLQFQISFVIRKIFESAGYTITEEVFSESAFFNKVVLFSNIITIVYLSTKNTIAPVMNSLQYSTLMPDIEVLSFLDSFKNMFCLMYEIDERKKEVRIKFKKDVFLRENLDTMKITELAGWTHSEKKAQKGFTLRYTAQDDELATYSDYPELIDMVSTLPAPTIEDKIVSLTSVTGRGRLYLTVKLDNEVLEWQKVGRLREVMVGDGENVAEINVKIPDQTPYKIFSGQNEWNLECPALRNIVRSYKNNKTIMPYLAITLYHGIHTLEGRNISYASFDQYSLDGTIDTGMSLKPIYLYDNLYSEFLNWQTYRARAFTKFIELTLVQLIALQWGKQYNIGGIDVILDKINYELPHNGTVKIEGFTG